MKRRFFASLLAVLLCFGLFPVSADAKEEIIARDTPGNGNPYYIMVNRKMSTVTVYGLDENGFYTVPVRAMLCSTGSSQHATPRGNFSIGVKYRWHEMLGGVYAQYLSQFRGACYFHSVCYARPSSDTLLPGYYDRLGSPASHGCIRLQTEDAKWIYENCAESTFVTVYDGNDPGELGKPEKMVPAPGATNACRWDPTDPEPENPWAGAWTTDFTLSAETIRLEPGETASLQIARLPEGSTYPTAMYFSDSTAVAVADGAGRIRAVNPGTCTVTVRCGGVEKLCTVVVGPSEPWYAADMQFLLARGFVAEDSPINAAPEAVLTRTEALDLLSALFPAGGTCDETGGGLSRGGFLEYLYLCHRLYTAPPVPGESAAAWALRVGLLYGGSEGGPALEQTITHAQAAAILHRYCVIFNV